MCFGSFQGVLMCSACLGSFSLSFFVGLFLAGFKVCEVVLIGVRFSWSIQVVLGCSHGCLGLFQAVSNR